MPPPPHSVQFITLICAESATILTSQALKILRPKSVKDRKDVDFIETVSSSAKIEVISSAMIQRIGLLSLSDLIVTTPA